MDIADGASSSTHSEKTCVTILHEMCKKFGFGVALYNLGRKSGKVPNETFWMKLTIKLLDISVTGSGRTKINAKHDAALRLMLVLMKTTREGRSLKYVSKDKLVACCEWMQQYATLNEEHLFQAPSAPHKESVENLSLKRMKRAVTRPI